MSTLRHGMCYTRSYRTWQSMINRCRNPNVPGYRDYGARDICVCARWLECFENFHADMGDKPENMTLERIDNDGDYCPENCRWATQSEQNRNRRKTIRVEWQGRKVSLAQLCEEMGLDYDRAFTRYSKGKPLEQVLSPQKLNLECFRDDLVLVTYKGTTKTLGEWGRTFGIRRATLTYRMEQGWSLDRVFASPEIRRKRNSPLEYGGRSMSVSEWAKEIGVDAHTIRLRLRKNWTVGKALFGMRHAD